MLKKRIVVCSQVAFTYIGTVVGAGFASGQEILQFFTLFGSKSVWGVFICIYFFSMVGIRIMLMGHRLNANSYQEFNSYLLGKKWGEWLNAFTGISLFGVSTAMLSGIGSLFEEQLNLSFHLGIFITVIFSLLVIYRGIEGLISINSFVVPLMICFVLIVFFLSWENLNMSYIFSISPVYQGNWAISALSYVAFNVALSQAVLVPLGASIADESSIRWGGWLGGIALGMMVMFANLLFLQNIDDVSNLAIPMAYVIGSLGPVIKLFFLCIVWAEIFTTLVGNIYGLGKSLEDLLPFRRSLIILSIFVLGYLCSFAGFPTLVGTLYPVLGYCGLLLSILVMVKQIPNKLQK